MGRLVSLIVTAALIPLGASDAAAAEPSSQEMTREIKLITGDRVVMRDNAITPVPGKGRQGMGFHTYEVLGHKYVVPLDAAEPVAAGRLDRRLFDVTALQDFGYANTPDLPVIVSGTGFKAVKGDGWQSLKASPAKVWLDGKRKLSLAQSVPQIGAPTVWQSGFTGKGITVAVLDTGIDATHPDFAGRISETKNFTSEDLLAGSSIDKDKDTDDKFGHGTHVASTIAGSGAASNGKYRGVAPDANLVIGKVCEADGCPESAILAGMEWAARQKKAQVVNLSLGGPNSEETDPLEAAIDQLTAETGTLFVVAAGNEGPGPETVNSPSTADAALSVGAVTKKDEDPFFSSRGPRFNDGAVKPEIAGPGAAIVAARAKNSELDPVDKSYAMMSGTSMATPHVAGAAALLAQRHPDWRAAELKSTLVSSAQPVKVDTFAVGAGRVDVARAVKQEVFATTNSVNFGLRRWPHDDDKPVDGKVTYRNTGTSPVTVKLGVTGEAFSTAAQEITVPAGGTTDVTVTANTRTGPDGYLTGSLIATAGDLRIGTPLAVHKEVESYDLKLTQLGRDGKPAPMVSTIMLGMDSLKAVFPYDLDGRLTLRRPKGRYIVDSHIPAKDSYTHLTKQLVTLDHDTELTLDARTAKLVQPKVPSDKVSAALLDVGFLRLFDTPFGRSGLLSGAVLYAAPPFYTAQLDPALPPEDMEVWLAFKLGEPGPDKDFAKSPVMYHLLWSAHGSYPTGFEPEVRQPELAEIRQHYHATPAGKFAYTWTLGFMNGLGHTAAGGPIAVSLPLDRAEYYLADGRIWSESLAQYRDADAPSEISNLYGREETFKPGTSTTRHWNRGVFTPAFEVAENAPGQYRSERTGDRMNIFAAPYVDSTPGRTGFPMDVKKASSLTLYRDGKLVAKRDDLFLGQFEGLPPDEATYRAELALQLDESVLPLSSKTSTAWTFRSAGTSQTTPLPLMNVRISPNLDANNKAPANQLFLVPVTVQRNRGSADAKVTDVTMESSFDDGANWQEVPVVAGNGIWYGLETNSAPDRYASLRVTATDEAGNRVEQTVIHAYRVS